MEDLDLCKYLLITMLLGSQIAYASSDEHKAHDKQKEVDIKFEKIMQTLSQKCETHEKKGIPVTTVYQFCSDSPFNNISVRYCVYQNLLVPENDESITIRFPEEISENNATMQITVSYKCADIQI